jgi:hypothetical protein
MMHVLCCILHMLCLFVTSYTIIYDRIYPITPSLSLSPFLSLTHTHTHTHTHIHTHTHTFTISHSFTITHSALRSTTGSLTGLNYPLNYGSGVEWAKGLIDDYNATSLQLGIALYCIVQHCTISLNITITLFILDPDNTTTHRSVAGRFMR